MSESPWRDEVVKCYVKQSLFPRRKFIEEESALEFSTENISICRQFLVYCNVNNEPRELQLQCWNESKEKIRSQLNERRNRVQSDMRKTYLCEFTVSDCVEPMLVTNTRSWLSQSPDEAQQGQK